MPTHGSSDVTTDVPYHDIVGRHPITISPRIEPLPETR